MVSDKDAVSDISPDILSLNNPANYSFHVEAAASINRRAFEILSKLEEISASTDPSSDFSTKLPGVTIIDVDKLEQSPIFEKTSISGQRIEKSFIRDQKHFGIQGENYTSLRLLSEHVAKATWIKELVGQVYVENALFSWCQEQFFLKEHQDFTEFLISKAKDVIKLQTVCVPLALMEIEENFTFGSVNIISLTPEFIGEREASCLSMSEKHRMDTRVLFEDISSKIQGIAAVSIELLGEDNHVKSRCYQIAKDAIGLLRIYSMAAYTPWVVCPCNTLGLEIAPSKTIITYNDTSFSFSEGSAASNIRRWRISRNELASMRSQGMDKVGQLLQVRGLNKFQDRVRSCLLAYSKGITLPDLGDRLIYTFSALEGLLLKDSSEPIQQNLGERMAFLIATEPSIRQSIVKNVRDAYSLRSRYIHHQIQISDESVLDNFIQNARVAFTATVNNIDFFTTQLDFINGIDNLKFGH